MRQVQEYYLVYILKWPNIYTKNAGMIKFNFDLMVYT